MRFLLSSACLAVSVTAFASLVPLHKRAPSIPVRSAVSPRSSIWHFGAEHEGSSMPVEIAEEEEEEQEQESVMEINEQEEEQEEQEDERKDDEEQEEEQDTVSAVDEVESVSEESVEADVMHVAVNGNVNGVTEPEAEDEDGEKDEQTSRDEANMRIAIDLVLQSGGEHSPTSAFPNPTAGAVLVAADGRVLGQAVSDYANDCVPAALKNAGIEAIPLHEWCVTWPASQKLRKDMHEATLYVTLEPSDKRQGQVMPPITQLIELCGIPRVVIGSPCPVQEMASKGASALHAAGIDVIMGSCFSDECLSLTSDFAQLANSKLQRMARKHSERNKRPLGFLHCSVVSSDNLEAFARAGNAFGKSYNGKSLSYRTLGAYEIAPPPEVIWADDTGGSTEVESSIESLDFSDEDFQESLSDSPVMPWYEQVDAVVATFPNAGKGPVDDDSVAARLNGLKWLATYGMQLPAGVERILVLDATDLFDLPLKNDDSNLPKNGSVDVEAFWAGKGRKPTRILLRRGDSALAQSAAAAAAKAAEGAAKAALAAKDALETGDAESAAEAAMECAQAAADATKIVQEELMASLERKRLLQDMGVIVETLSGSDPIDVMSHLGKRNGYDSVVWRAGCWGNRGVDAILAGAFQWVSAHLAVDAKGGKFWQLMLAERAVQSACGPESRVKVFAGAEDFSLEYCDEPDADSDCALMIDGKPVRHVRLDCRVALVDSERPREFVIAKTKRLDRKHIEEKAPWFL